MKVTEVEGRNKNASIELASNHHLSTYLITIEEQNQWISNSSETLICRILGTS
jgi:hypothetical protein